MTPEQLWNYEARKREKTRAARGLLTYLFGDKKWQFKIIQLVHHEI